MSEVKFKPRVDEKKIRPKIAADLPQSMNQKHLKKYRKLIRKQYEEAIEKKADDDVKNAVKKFQNTTMTVAEQNLVLRRNLRRTRIAAIAGWIAWVVTGSLWVAVKCGFFQ